MHEGPGRYSPAYNCLGCLGLLKAQPGEQAAGWQGCHTNPEGRKEKYGTGFGGRDSYEQTLELKDGVGRDVRQGLFSEKEGRKDRERREG